MSVRMRVGVDCKGEMGRMALLLLCDLSGGGSTFLVDSPPISRGPEIADVELLTPLSCPGLIQAAEPPWVCRGCGVSRTRLVGVPVAQSWDQ